MTTLPDDAKRLLDLPTIVHLAVLTEQGPHVSPVWVDREGDRILVNTAEGRVKTEAIRRDPRVGLSAIHPDDPYTRIVVRGRVVEMRHEGARAHIDKLAGKYRGLDRYPGPPEQERVILVIEPETVTR